MSTLYVVGDSFSIAPPKDDPTSTWCRQAAAQLGVPLYDQSLEGSSQDFAWMKLHTLIESGAITSDDYLLVVLTHPGRYWYLEHFPALSNVNIIDLDRWISPEQSKAVKLFIKHIQRPGLDCLHLINRLAWLELQVIKRQLRKPLLIRGFEQKLFQYEQNENLNITQGNLFSGIQYHELADPLDPPEWTKYIDPRYNHMCLSNHRILGQRVAHSLRTGTELDLVTGYHRSLLTDQNLNNVEFCDRELNGDKVKLLQTSIKPKRLPWMKRTNIIKDL